MEEGGYILHQDDSNAASWINVLLAIWVVIAPFVLVSALSPAAMWNNVATGAAVGVLALVHTSLPRQVGWSWLNVVLGIWLIISPFVLGFSTPRLLWNDVILGAIIALVGLSNVWSTSRADARPV